MQCFKACILAAVLKPALLYVLYVWFYVQMHTSSSVVKPAKLACCCFVVISKETQFTPGAYQNLCLGSVAKPAQGCELHRCMCCKTMSGRLTEERMSCNSERVLVLRSLNECISAETKSVAASIQTTVTVTCDTFPLRPLNPRNLNMWHLFPPLPKPRKP